MTVVTEDFKMPSALQEVPSYTSTNTALYDMMRDQMKEACGLANAHMALYGISFMRGGKVIDPREVIRPYEGD